MNARPRQPLCPPPAAGAGVTGAARRSIDGVTARWRGGGAGGGASRVRRSSGEGHILTVEARAPLCIRCARGSVDEGAAVMDPVPSLTLTPAGEERTPSPHAQRKASHDRRGSQNLLQSAGIGIERRRRSSTGNYRIENNQVLYENDDGKTERMEIVKIHEKHGRFRKAIPYMPLPVAAILCILNVITPSIGTFLSGLMVLCWGPSEYETRCQTVTWSLLAGLLQLITLPIVVGWIWSIMWGVAFVQDSMAKSMEKKEQNDVET